MANWSFNEGHPWLSAFSLCVGVRLRVRTLSWERASLVLLENCLGDTMVEERPQTPGLCVQISQHSEATFYNLIKQVCSLEPV